MFTRESPPLQSPPSVSQKQMRVLSDLWDKTFIHFEQGGLQKLQQVTKDYLKPNVVYRSFIERWAKEQNESGNYNRAEEILARIMSKDGAFDKVGFESQYRVVQDATIYEQVNAGIGVRDATIKEEPILVIGKYKDRAGAEHNIFAALNPIVNKYTTEAQVSEYNHFAERAKLPVEQEKEYHCFAKGDSNEVLYKVSVGTLVSGEHASKTVPRGSIGGFLRDLNIESIQKDAAVVQYEKDIPIG